MSSPGQCANKSLWSSQLSFPLEIGFSPGGRKNERKRRPPDQPKIILVIVGEDGSFMNIVMDLNNYGINLDSMVFTSFPFGTANDLSRTFNWGATPSRKMKYNLEYL